MAEVGVRGGAGRAGAVMRGEEDGMRRAGAQVADLVEGVFGLLEETRDRVLQARQAAAAAGRALTTDDLAGLRPLLAAHLDSHERLLAGTGVVVGPGTLADRPGWLEWWRRSPEGTVTFLDVDLDPESDRYYDYTGADWFCEPQRTHRRAVVGPYVDYSGTDEYVVTLTTPIVADGAFLGVAGADLHLKELERAVVPALAAVPGPAVLLNADGRVMVSTSPRWIAGSLVRELGHHDGDAELAVAAGTLRAQRCRDLPWRVATLLPA